jgi:RNA polymerase II-associated protein 1
VAVKEEPMLVEDFPIGPEDAKKWLHMDVVETEKLKWMKKLPKPKPVTTGDPYPARFDFEGSNHYLN